MNVSFLEAKTVLIVEDNESFSAPMRKALEGCKANVVGIARYPEEAYDLLTDITQLDIALFDHNLLTGFGYEIALWMAEQSTFDSTTRISCSGMPNLLSMVPPSAFHAFMQKPVGDPTTFSTEFIVALRHAIHTSLFERRALDHTLLNQVTQIKEDPQNSGMWSFLQQRLLGKNHGKK